MHNYKFDKHDNETTEEFRKRVEGYCKDKAVLAIEFISYEEHPYATVKSFEEL